MKVAEFTSSVWDIVEDIKKWKAIKADEGHPFFISEFQDEDGNQYINFVQEGGGMLGIALAGFTYVLEKAGVRFLGLAGTSAGSINSYLMSAIGRPEEEKSERILRHLINKDFMDFIDGGKDARMFIDLVSSEGKIGWLKVFSKPLLLWNLKDLNNRQGMNPGNTFEQWLDEVLLCERIFDRLKAKYFSNANERIPREKLLQSFHEQINHLHVFKKRAYECKFPELKIDDKEKIVQKAFDKDTPNKASFDLEEASEVIYKTVLAIQKELKVKLVVYTLAELQEHIQSNEKKLDKKDYFSLVNNVLSSTHNTPENNAQKVDKKCAFALIGADITTQTKVIFPEMADLYYEDLQQVNPSELVRASMSVPILFEPLRISLEWANPSKANYQTIRKKWSDRSRFKGEIPNEVLIVDGGIMSNFPLDVFEELENRRKRQEEEKNKKAAKEKNQTYKRGFSDGNDHTTTIGVKLGLDRLKSNTNNSFTGIIGQCFNNAREIRDFESIYNNPLVSDESIAYIDTENFNWLDFKMNQEEMKALFREGARAAADFIRRFNYRKYNSSRNSKSSDMTRDKLLTDVHHSKFVNQLQKFQMDRLNRKQIEQAAVDQLVKELKLPKDMQNYWADENKENQIQFRLRRDPDTVQSKEIANDLYQTTRNMQAISAGIKEKHENKTWNDVKNVLLRISLIRNVFNLSKNATIYTFPVLWVVESVDYNDIDNNDTLLKSIIDYSGGSIQTINHKEEAVQCGKNLNSYKLVVIKAYQKDLDEANCELLSGLNIHQDDTKDVIAYVNDSVETFIPKTNIRIYNDPIDFLHRVLDNFHRNIKWV